MTRKARLPPHQKIDLEHLWTLTQAVISTQQALAAFLKATPKPFQEAYERATMSAGEYVRKVMTGELSGDAKEITPKGAVKLYLDQLRAFTKEKNKEKQPQQKDVSKP